MPDYHRSRRPPVEPNTGRPVDRRQIGCFKPFPQLPRSKQAGAFSALARAYRGAKTQIGDDGYPYIAAPTATQFFEKELWDVK